MKKKLSGFISAVLSLTLVFSVFSSALIDAGAVDTVVFSVSVVEETDASAVISVNLESGEFNCVDLCLAAGSAVNACTGVTLSEGLESFREQSEAQGGEMVTAFSADTLRCSIATVQAYSTPGSIVIYSLEKALASTLGPGDISLTVGDCRAGDRIADFEVLELVPAPRSYTLSFDANGGEDAPAQLSGALSYTVPSEAPHKSGFSFLGWALIHGAQTADYLPNDEITLAGDTVLYAVWKPNAVQRPVIRDLNVEDVTLFYKQSEHIKPNVTADPGASYTVRYISSDKSVAAVESNGSIRAEGTGTAEIRCIVTDSYGNVLTDTFTVTVEYNLFQWLIIILLFGWLWY